MRLTRTERAFAELVFAAIVPGDPAGRRSFAQVDTAAFWRHLHEDGAPTLIPGLRAMLLAVALWPLAAPGFRRPFAWLAPADRSRFLATLDDDPRYVPRQLVATLKILAAFAWFDDPVARALAGAAP